MTDEQKESIIKLYTHANITMNEKLTLMDTLDDKARTAADEKHRRRAERQSVNADRDSSYELGKMAGIATVLSVLGFSVMVDDEGNAAEIVAED